MDVSLFSPRQDVGARKIRRVEYCVKAELFIAAQYLQFFRLVHRFFAFAGRTVIKERRVFILLGIRIAVGVPARGHPVTCKHAFICSVQHVLL